MFAKQRWYKIEKKTPSKICSQNGGTASKQQRGGWDSSRNGGSIQRYIRRDKRRRGHDARSQRGVGHGGNSSKCRGLCRSRRDGRGGSVGRVEDTEQHPSLATQYNTPHPSRREDPSGTGNTHLSSTCTTPLLVKTSASTTLAELTNTCAPSLRTVMFCPCSVGSVIWSALNKSVLNRICCARTWYPRMPTRSSVVKLPSADPMALNASFDGAKMVTSESELTVLTSPAAVKAPASEVRPVLMAVCAGLAGTVRTVSMTWMTPPSNWTSWGKCQGALS
jgi:hypothetical protein